MNEELLDERQKYWQMGKRQKYKSPVDSLQSPAKDPISTNLCDFAVKCILATGYWLLVTSYW
jgi:hypothetical protein